MQEGAKLTVGGGPTDWRDRLCLVVSIGLLGVMVIVYVGQFDACAAMTLFPIWVWLIPGFLLLGLARRANRRVRRTVAALWMVGSLVLADAPLSLVRQFTQALPHTRVHDESFVLRVITLNCASIPDAIAEAERFDPDIVLIQESPGEAAVNRIARQLYGRDAGVLWGVDASIIARGSITPISIPAASAGDFVHARIRLESGRTVEAVSLRLSPSPVRLDHWNPDCWNRYTQDRRTRRSELARLVQHLEPMSSETPVVIGGDFNAPPGDAIFRLLRSRFRDVFPQSGLGWGNTILNEWPFLRIDQIWSSNHFSPVAAIAQHTEHSDHRMVIADLRWQEARF